MRRRGIMGALIVLAMLLPLQAATGASPEGRIKLVDSPGFASAGEVVLANGAVIDTFVSGDTVVRVIGDAGTTVKAQKVTGKDGKSSVSLEMTSTKPKDLSKLDDYAKSGRSAVNDLISLGVDPLIAQEQFGDMDTLDPVGEKSSSWNGTQVASADASFPFADITQAVTPSSTTPWATQCATVGTGGGEITGQGCSTLFVIAASGSDWWLNNKYKLSAHSTEPASAGCLLTGIGCPWRLTKVGWSLAFGAGNSLYDWDPAANITQGSCNQVSISANYHGFGISISGSVCPDKLTPWNLTSTKSGAEWQGLEHSTDWEAAIGLNAVHSPPSAALTYSSPYELQFVHFPN